MTLSARPTKNRRPALAPPNAVTVTFGWSAPKASLKVSAKNTRNGGQRSACASSRWVRNTGSAVASAPPDRLARTDQPGKIERFGRYGDRGFHAPLSDAISEEVETRGASSGHSSAPPRTQHHAGREYAPSLRESFICLSRPGPVTIPRYAPLPVRGSVHLSRQSLEKLTECAIIKVAP